MSRSQNIPKASGCPSSFHLRYDCRTALCCGHIEVPGSHALRVFFILQIYRDLRQPLTTSSHDSKLPESSTRRGTKPSTIYTSEYKHENIMSDIQFRPAKTVSRYHRDRLAYMTTEIDRLV